MPRTRTQIAHEIAVGAVLFVRDAHADGHANLITDLALQEVAAERGYTGEQWTLRTARDEARQMAQIFGVRHLIAFGAPGR